MNTQTAIAPKTAAAFEGTTDWIDGRSGTWLHVGYRPLLQRSQAVAR